MDVYSRVTSFLATLYADFADESIKVHTYIYRESVCVCLFMYVPVCVHTNVQIDPTMAPPPHKQQTHTHI